MHSWIGVVMAAAVAVALVVVWEVVVVVVTQKHFGCMFLAFLISRKLAFWNYAWCAVYAIVASRVGQLVRVRFQWLSEPLLAQFLILVSRVLGDCFGLETSSKSYFVQHHIDDLLDPVFIEFWRCFVVRRFRVFPGLFKELRSSAAAKVGCRGAPSF